jgi:Uma2 family endonuclease
MAVERAEQLSRPRELTADEVAVREAARPPLRLFDVDEYHRMAEVGILRPDERLELIEGEIRAMSPIGSKHLSAVVRLTTLFVLKLHGLAEISIQNSVRLVRRVEPEPDVAVLRKQPGVARPYEAEHPTPEDVLLLVEVADSSTDWDLGEKAELYARYGVPELWVLDLPADRVVIHRDPTADGYASVVELPRDGSISPLAFPDVSFTADDLLGPRASADDESRDDADSGAPADE